MNKPETPVLVIGGGPVGLTAAIDLAWRGIDVVVVESRYAGEPPTVKCNHISSRSMEIMRRLGLSETIRAAGLPHDYPNDIVFCTSVTGIEFGRVKIPSVDGRKNPPSPEYADSDWPTPESPHRINQIYLEPILFRHASAQTHIKILNRTMLVDISQSDEMVIATLRNLDTLEETAITARYAIGCDGARSVVRHKIDAKFLGIPEISRNLSSFIRAPALLDMIRVKRTPSWMSHAINPRRAGNAIAIDGKELWLVHCRAKASEPDFDLIDRDRAIRDVLGVDDAFEYELLSKEDWIARRLVADKMRDRRIFLCGDAAHIWIPVAGYGMNCGIADAADLTWMLAAVCKGWLPETALDAFEAERHPITEQVSRFVADLGIQLVPRRNEPPKGIDEISAEGDAVRERFGQEMCEMNVSQYCCAGLNFGYYYDESPIIAYDGETQPAYTMGSFTSSTVPGCRLPHAWLGDGRSLYDLLGPDYTLIRLNPELDASDLESAAKAAGFPLTVVNARFGKASAPYSHALMLVRPDQHIAWRGHKVPDDVQALLSRLRGDRKPQVAEL